MKEPAIEIPIIYSTITGNAFRLAYNIKDLVPNYMGPYNISYIFSEDPYDTFSLNREILKEYDTFILTYWCDRGSCDKPMKKLLKDPYMKNKNIIILGTLGARMESDHAKDVYNNVSNLVKENNNLIGHFLCRGAVDMKRVFRRIRLNKAIPSHDTKDRLEEQKKSLKHPTKKDFKNARKFIKDTLTKL